MKIYTKSGDRKTTGLLGGHRLTKSSFRIEAIGSVDELNSFLGFLLSLSQTMTVNRRARVIKIPFNRIIAGIQKNLFVIGSNLAHPMIQSKSIPHPLHKHYAGRAIPGAAPALPRITLEQVQGIEDMIDHFQKNLPPLRHFILPQGNPIASALQVTRAICRRTERRVVQLAMHAKVDPLSLAYLNRLSDLLFVLARAVNHKTKRGDIIWKIPKKTS